MTALVAPNDLNIDFHKRLQTAADHAGAPNYQPGHITITDPLITLESETAADWWHAFGLITLSGLTCDQWVDRGLVHKRAVAADGTKIVVAWPVTG